MHCFCRSSGAPHSRIISIIPFPAGPASGPPVRPRFKDRAENASRILRRRGQPIAYLGVDSENPTGAMHLYGSAGFARSHRATLVFERTLRSSRPGGGRSVAP